MRQIPIHIQKSYAGYNNSLPEYNWINYNEEIFIIEHNDKGNEADFQVEGTMCRQRSVKGFIFKSFKSKNKYFNPNYWYKKTCWGEEYPKKIFFNEPKFDKVLEPLNADWDILETMPVGPERDEYVTTCSDNFWDKSKEFANQFGRPVENILKNILSEVIRKTGIQFELDFEDLDYGNYWSEAYIPLKYKKKKYLLTWENCD